MEIRYASSNKDAKSYDTKRLREEYLIQDLFTIDNIKLVYSHYDRIIVGGVYPVTKGLKLEGGKELGSSFFLERRELGVINVGGPGKMILDKVEYEINNKDAIYIGMGVEEIEFLSIDPKNPAKFYLNSAPAHHKYPTIKIGLEDARKVKLGSTKTSNKRTINQYIHPDVCQSCQLVMGMTMLEDGSTWNSMPCHTHDRRMEVYFYFDMDEDTRIFHLMGEPTETRHIVMKKDEAVISPSWSIHSGVGTASYTFIWGMVGENQIFTDMDHVSMEILR
ncbi:5-dehydro-4-deoxy-D-glucuronate isomerase [Fusobacterium sp.]|uniref:5-dehydro-4-deoxy-D-glucuronate isomerase n=1 Tax=Fusobacterium sp. TaxID=68766 RepID=UPI00261F32C3|nr:5-dehydro-4-deoxy-D-glucuronate isomerase [Fusobacterium sp.]